MEPIPLFDNNSNQTLNENLCPICLDTMNIDNNIYTIPECNHKFHTDCIIGWFRSTHDTCPLCRSNRLANVSPYSHKNLFTMIINYSRRKNASKNVVKLVNKYKKYKNEIVKANKIRKEFEKNNKDLLQIHRKLKNKKWLLAQKVRIIKREILSIPIQSIKIIKK